MFIFEYRYSVFMLKKLSDTSKELLKIGIASQNGNSHEL